MLSRVGFTLLLLPIAALAEDRCPWMNAATAGGYLGGTPTTQVKPGPPDSDDASCSFELRAGETLSKLTIDVTTMRSPQRDFTAFLAQCPTKTALKAIGNEAVSCSGADHSTRSELVVGRVRDHAFVLRLSTNAASPDSAALHEKAVKAAEQVAGILF